MPKLTPQQYRHLIHRAETLAATRDQDYVTPAHARTITGLTRRQITPLADTNVLTVQRTSSGGDRSYLKKTLIEYTTEALGQPLTVFDAVLHSAAENGIRMDQATYRADEATLRNCEGFTGTRWQVETRDHLVEPSDKALAAWHRGEHQRALNLLQGERPAMAARRALDQQMGITVRTLWAPSIPLSFYQRFQLHTHRLHTDSGMSVKVLTPNARDHLEYSGSLPEMVVYDGQVVYLPHHTPQCRPNGATRIDDPDLASALGTQLTDLFAEASALDLFARPHL